MQNVVAWAYWNGSPAHAGTDSSLTRPRGTTDNSPNPQGAADPRDLLANGAEPKGVQQENEEGILEAAEVADLVVAAYGVHGSVEAGPTESWRR